MNKFDAKVLAKGDGKVKLEHDGLVGEYKLGEKVKPEYIKENGIAEVSEENGIVSFIKMKKVVQTPLPTADGYLEEKKEFWKVKHIVKSDLTDEELEVVLNETADTDSNSFVFATQTHLVDGKWGAVIFMKEKPQ